MCILAAVEQEGASKISHYSCPPYYIFPLIYLYLTYSLKLFPLPLPKFVWNSNIYFLLPVYWFLPPLVPLNHYLDWPVAIILYILTNWLWIYVVLLRWTGTSMTMIYSLLILTYRISIFFTRQFWKLELVGMWMDWTWTSTTSQYNFWESFKLHRLVVGQLKFRGNMFTICWMWMVACFKFWNTLVIKIRNRWLKKTFDCELRSQWDKSWIVT